VLVHRLGVPDRFVPHGPLELLRKELGLDAEGAVRASRELLGRRDNSSGAKSASSAPGSEK